MTPFGRFPDRDLFDLASDAALGALADADLSMTDVGVLAAGTVFHANESVGQQLLKQIGQTGIPVFNVANACATGATALRTASMAIAAGDTDVAARRRRRADGQDRTPGDRDCHARGPPGIFAPEGRVGAVASTEGILGTDDDAGRVRDGRHWSTPTSTSGVGLEQFARVAEKNHAHSTLNPLAQYRKRFTLDEILAAPMISYPNTTLMCSPTADGAAAAVLVSDERLRNLPDETRRRAVKVTASVITTDPWTERGQALPDFNTLTRNAARQAYETAGVDPGRPRPRRAPRLLRDRRAAALRQPRALRARRGRPLHRRPADRGATARPRSTSRAASSPKGTPSARPASPASTRSRPTCAARPATARSTAPRIGLAHVLGLGATCAVHILERPREPTGLLIAGC